MGDFYWNSGDGWGLYLSHYHHYHNKPLHLSSDPECLVIGMLIYLDAVIHVFHIFGVRTVFCDIMVSGWLVRRQSANLKLAIESLSFLRQYRQEANEKWCQILSVPFFSTEWHQAQVRWRVAQMRDSLTAEEPCRKGPCLYVGPGTRRRERGRARSGEKLNQSGEKCLRQGPWWGGGRGSRSWEVPPLRPPTRNPLNGGVWAWDLDCNFLQSTTVDWLCVESGVGRTAFPHKACQAKPCAHPWSGWKIT